MKTILSILFFLPIMAFGQIQFKNTQFFMNSHNFNEEKILGIDFNLQLDTNNNILGVVSLKDTSLFDFITIAYLPDQGEPVEFFDFSAYENKVNLSNEIKVKLGSCDSLREMIIKNKSLDFVVRYRVKWTNEFLIIGQNLKL